MFKELFGYGEWIGYSILIVLSILFTIMGKKSSKLWYGAAVVFFLFAVVIFINEYLGIINI